MSSTYCNTRGRSFVNCLIVATLISLSTLTFAQANHKAHVVQNPENKLSAEFSLKLGDIVNPYSIFSIFVLPNQTLDLEILYSQSKAGYYFTDAEEGVRRLVKDDWTWTAPSTPGIVPLMLKSEDGDEKMRINVFVKVPAKEVDGGKIKYFQIGHYPTQDEIKNPDIYVIPDGFVEVTEANKDTRVSPHFKLKEFVSKQSGGYPKFVYLQNELLLKLEMIRHELTLQSVPVNNMVIMSGYRTPYYNKAIGNVKFSRHVFGDAADIFIDNDGDYRMDDLNNDGEFDVNDAIVMSNVVESLAKRESYKGLIGGLGIYGPKSHRGSFIHVDTRGVKARWKQ